MASDVELTCPNCGARVYPTDAACMECGFDLICARPADLTHSEATAARYIDYGEAALERGRTRQALAHFDRAIALQPRSSRAHLARAVLLGQQGNTEAAYASACSALQFDQENPDATRAVISGALALADDYARRGSWAQATQVIEGAIRRFPHSEELAAARVQLEQSSREAAVRKEEQAAEDAAAGAGTAVGAGVGGMAGAAVGVGGMIGGLLTCCLALMLMAAGAVLCLTCIGALIGIPLIISGAGMFTAGVSVCAGAPVVGTGIAAGGTVAGRIAGKLSRRARRRNE